MTLASMRREVFRRLPEASGAPVFWSVADVDAALNDGLRELSDATDWNETHRRVDLLADRPYYDARRVLSDGLLTIGPAFHSATNRWLIATSPRDFGVGDRWARTAGSPQRLLVRALWWIGYWPLTHTDRDSSVTQYFTELPAPLVEDDDEPAFPETFHAGCLAYAVADLWAQDGETTLALAAWQEYLGIEQALQSWVHERLAVPTVHVLGAGR